jgi:hypothetical protein
VAARADEHFDLDEEELNRRVLARRSALEDMAEFDLGLFIELHTPDYYAPEHLRPLLDALDRSMREPVWALIEIPPRHAKTETILHGLARRLRYRPKDDVAYCSYAGPLALRKSRKAREIAARSGVWAEEARTILRDRRNPASAVSYWQTVDGGSFTAGGRNGSFVGDGYGTIVYDDPFKNRGEAESPVIQETAIDTWRGLTIRVEPEGSGFVSHQAWNDQDVIAVLKAEMDTPEGQDWELISLPAIFDAEYDDTGRLIGGTPLWPARWSLEALAKRKYQAGDYNWYSQFTNDRLPHGDRIFADPARYTGPPMVNQAVVLISCDPGIEDDKTKDSSGIVVAAAYRRPTPHHTAQKPDFEIWLDILHVEDRWLDPTDLLDHLERLQTAEFRGAPVLLEEVSAFRMLSRIAARLNPKLGLYAVTPRGSKLLRAQPTAKAWNRGHVRVPLNAPWVVDFLRETSRFTGRSGGKDNRVDALTQLFDYAESAFAGMASAASGGEVEAANSPW